MSGTSGSKVQPSDGDFSCLSDGAVDLELYFENLLGNVYVCQSVQRDLRD